MEITIPHNGCTASTSGRPFASSADYCSSRPRRPSAYLRCRSSVEGAESRGQVTLLDYGAGNVRSVRNAIKKLGFTPKEVPVC